MIAVANPVKAVSNLIAKRIISIGITSRLVGRAMRVQEALPARGAYTVGAACYIGAVYRMELEKNFKGWDLLRNCYFSDAYDI